MEIVEKLCALAVRTERVFIVVVSVERSDDEALGSIRRYGVVISTASILFQDVLEVNRVLKVLDIVLVAVVVGVETANGSVVVL